jgi:hypothetical protein
MTKQNNNNNNNNNNKKNLAPLSAVQVYAAGGQRGQVHGGAIRGRQRHLMPFKAHRDVLRRGGVDQPEQEVPTSCYPETGVGAALSATGRTRVG